MRIDWHAAAIVGDAQCAVGFQFDFDTIGEAGYRFVHGIIEHFGEEVMQRPLVDAANVHSRPFPHRFKPLQDLNVLGGIGPSRRRWRLAAAE